MSKPILHISHLSKSFGGLALLKDVNFTLEGGSITSLFGDNGSGKTTLFHLISGFLQADNGSIRINDKELTNKPAIQCVKAGIGRVWQSPRIFKNTTVFDNLLIANPEHPGCNPINYLINRKRINQAEERLKTEVEEVIIQIGLEGKLGKTAGTLSFGQQKLLSIGMLLMQKASILLLDEPFAGINPVMIQNMSQILLQLKATGTTILLIEHHQQLARNISDAVLLLNDGYIQLNPESL